MSNGFVVIRLIFRIEEEAIANLGMKTIAFATFIIMKNIEVDGKIAENVVVFLGKKSLKELPKIR